MPKKELTKYLSGIYRITKGSINQKISGLNIRATQSDILIFINDHPGLTQKKIAMANCVDPSLLARDLALLENNGWIVRQSDDKDRRVRKVALSPTGQKLVIKLKAISQEWWSNFTKLHPEIDLVTFTALTEQIYKTLNKRDEN